LHGDVDKAIDHYTEAVPPLSRSERLVLHRSCKQCRLARCDANAAVSDTTRGHVLVRQVYDMKGTGEPPRLCGLRWSMGVRRVARTRSFHTVSLG
jgi:hypothetical protein